MQFIQHRAEHLEIHNHIVDKQNFGGKHGRVLFRLRERGGDGLAPPVFNSRQHDPESAAVFRLAGHFDGTAHAGHQTL